MGRTRVTRPAHTHAPAQLPMGARHEPPVHPPRAAHPRASRTARPSRSGGAAVLPTIGRKPAPAFSPSHHRCRPPPRKPYPPPAPLRDGGCACETRTSDIEYFQRGVLGERARQRHAFLIAEPSACGGRTAGGLSGLCARTASRAMRVRPPAAPAGPRIRSRHATRSTPTTPIRPDSVASPSVSLHVPTVLLRLPTGCKRPRWVAQGMDRMRARRGRIHHDAARARPRSRTKPRAPRAPSS